MDLAYEHDAVVVVAGVPGAGKSTLIRRAVDRTAAAVVDTDDERSAAGGDGSYARHYGRIAAAVLGARPVVVHSRGTVGTRRAVALLARLRGRPAHLLLLDATARRRGRPAPARPGARARAWTASAPLAAPAGPRLAGEGWTSVRRCPADRGRRRAPTMEATYPRGRQASTRLVRGGGCEPRYRRPR